MNNFPTLCKGKCTLAHVRHNIIVVYELVAHCAGTPAVFCQNILRRELETPQTYLTKFRHTLAIINGDGSFIVTACACQLYVLVFCEVLGKVPMGRCVLTDALIRG